MQTMSLSVVIPIRRPERYVSNLKNLLIQDGSEQVHFIFIHDMENQESSEKLCKFKTEYLQIKLSIIGGSFGSAGAARNAGLNICDSEWIAFCDADDFLDIPVILKILQQPRQSSIIVGQFLRINQSSDSVGGVPSSKLADLYVDPGFWRVLYKRELIKSLRFSNLKMGEDIVFLADVLRENPPVDFISDIIYKYSVESPLQSTSIQSNFNDLSNAINLIKSRNPNWTTSDSDYGLVLRLSLSQFKNNDSQSRIKKLLGLILLLTRSPIKSFIFFRRLLKSRILE